MFIWTNSTMWKEFPMETKSHRIISGSCTSLSVTELLSLLPPGFFLFLVLWLSDSSLVSSAVTQSRKLHYKHSDKPAVATCRHRAATNTVMCDVEAHLYTGTWPNDSILGVWDVSCCEMDVATTETPNGWQSLDLRVLSAAGPTILFSAVRHW